MSNFEQEEYHDKVNSKFADYMYKKMASERYGLNFCCPNDSDKYSIKKELEDFNGQYDSEACTTICDT